MTHPAHIWTRVTRAARYRPPRPPYALNLDRYPLMAGYIVGPGSVDFLDHRGAIIVPTPSGFTQFFGEHGFSIHATTVNDRYVSPELEGVQTQTSEVVAVHTVSRAPNVGTSGSRFWLRIVTPGWGNALCGFQAAGTSAIHLGSNTQTTITNQAGSFSGTDTLDAAWTAYDVLQGGGGLNSITVYWKGEQVGFDQDSLTDWNPTERVQFEFGVPFSQGRQALSHGHVYYAAPGDHAEMSARLEGEPYLWIKRLGLRAYSFPSAAPTDAIEPRPADNFGIRSKSTDWNGIPLSPVIDFSTLATSDTLRIVIGALLNSGHSQGIIWSGFFNLESCALVAPNLIGIAGLAFTYPGAITGLRLEIDINVTRRVDNDWDVSVLANSNDLGTQTLESSAGQQLFVISRLLSDEALTPGCATMYHFQARRGDPLSPTEVSRFYMEEGTPATQITQQAGDTSPRTGTMAGSEAFEWDWSDTPSFTATAAAVTQAHALSEPIVGMSATLTPDALTQPHNIEQASVVGDLLLSPDAVSQPHTLSEPSLTPDFTISAAAITQPHNLSLSAITAPNVVNPFDIVQQHALADPQITPNTQIDPNDVLQLNILAPAPVTQAGAENIAPDALTQAHSIDQASIAFSSILTPAALTQAHTLSQPAIGNILVTDPLTQQHDIEQATLEFRLSLMPSSINQQHALSIAAVQGLAVEMQGKIVVVESDDLVIYITREPRQTIQ